MLMKLNSLKTPYRWLSLNKNSANMATSLWSTKSAQPSSVLHSELFLVLNNLTTNSLESSVSPNKLEWLQKTSLRRSLLRDKHSITRVHYLPLSLSIAAMRDSNQFLNKFSKSVTIWEDHLSSMLETMWTDYLSVVLLLANMKSLKNVFSNQHRLLKPKSLKLWLNKLSLSQLMFKLPLRKTKQLNRLSMKSFKKSKKSKQANQLKLQWLSILRKLSL